MQCTEKKYMPRTKYRKKSKTKDLFLKPHHEIFPPISAHCIVSVFFQVGMMDSYGIFSAISFLA
jgi:hypothetical protein